MVRRKARLLKFLWLLVGIPLVCILVMAVIFATTCPREKARMGLPYPPMGAKDDVALKATLADATTLASQTALTAPEIAHTRKLIREAWVSLLVQDVPKVAQEVRQLAEEFDGYLALSSQTRRPDGSWKATLILRVPDKHYQNALSRLQQLGQVDDLNEQVQDVTEEFVDLEARLRNLKRLEQRLLELLKRAGKVSDLLQVEKELSLRRQEIERLEGRLRYLTHQVTFSTIHVTLSEFRARLTPGTAFSVPKVFADALRALVLVLRGILVIAVWVLVFGIIWLPLFVIVWWVWKVRRAEKGAVAGGSK